MNSRSNPVLLLSLCAALLAGCATRPPQRHAWVTGLKPEKAADYRELHAHPWPSVMSWVAPTEANDAVQ